MSKKNSDKLSELDIWETQRQILEGQLVVPRVDLGRGRSSYQTIADMDEAFMNAIRSVARKTVEEKLDRVSTRCWSGRSRRSPAAGRFRDRWLTCSLSRRRWMPLTEQQLINLMNDGIVSRQEAMRRLQLTIDQEIIRSLMTVENKLDEAMRDDGQAANGVDAPRARLVEEGQERRHKCGDVSDGGGEA